MKTFLQTTVLLTILALFIPGLASADARRHDGPNYSNYSDHHPRKQHFQNMNRHWDRGPDKQWNNGPGRNYNHGPKQIGHRSHWNNGSGKHFNHGPKKYFGSHRNHWNKGHKSHFPKYYNDRYSKHQRRDDYRIDKHWKNHRHHRR
jgi:hypothetical protein